MKHLKITLKMSRKILLITFILLVSMFFAVSAFADEYVDEFAYEELEYDYDIMDEFFAEETVVEEEYITGDAIVEETVTEEEAVEETVIVEETTIEPSEETAVVIVDDYEYTFDENIIPTSIRNNEFYRESQRLARVAQNTYDYGDYDASSGFAEEAIRLAGLSDEYVAGQLIIEAKRLLDWADTYNIATLHPNNYNLGKSHYDNAVIAHSNEEWPESIDYGIKSIEVLSVLKAGMSGTTTVAPTRPVETRPAETTGRQYTVRTWAVEKDCLWNIAGYDWIYGDPWKWRLLYDANKSKLPDPNNPDWVEPGLVLDIPLLN